MLMLPPRSTVTFEFGKVGVPAYQLLFWLRVLLPAFWVLVLEHQRVLCKKWSLF